MRFLVLGNPENRRVTFFREACSDAGLPAPIELAWRDYLSNPGLLEERLADCAALRIESPGENFEVERALIGCGGGPEELEDDPGRLRFQPEWYRGWTRVLAEIGEQLPKGVPVMNPPRDIAQMFDKFTCQQRLQDAGVPIPDLLGTAESGQAVFELMDRAGVNRVFVKPRHSSSASGIVALQRQGRRIRAVTPVELVTREDETLLYNTLRLRTLTDLAEVRLLLDQLAPQRLLVERWYPKAGFDGRTFDLRILVVGGRAHQAVARASRSPITNLHLGNQRGDLDAIREAMGAETWRRLEETCEGAAACFPDSLYVAVDLLVAPSFQSEVVAEVNAFGDLLPNLFHEGLDTYGAELKVFLDRLV